MKLRRSIALLLCTLYLLATGSMAMASTRCHCHHEEPCHHHAFHFEGACCGDHHELELALYTFDEEIASRRVVRAVLPILLATKNDSTPEIPTAKLIHTLRYQVFTPLLQEGVVSVGSLRAPPATH